MKLQSEVQRKFSTTKRRKLHLVFMAVSQTLPRYQYKVHYIQYEIVAFTLM